MIRKVRILGIAPYQGLVTLMNQYAKQYPEVNLTAIFGNMEAGMELAKKHYQDYDVIISRANTASLISKVVTIPVIDIGIDHYDVLRCIKMAESTKTKFAILGFRSLTSIAKTICDLLKISADVYSISTPDEASRLLDQLKELGYRTVICDTVPYNHAKLIGLTPILLTSSVESLKSAIRNAVRTWENHQELYRSMAMMRQVLANAPGRYLVLDLEGESLFSTLEAETDDLLTERLREELPLCQENERRSFFITVNNQMYSVQAELSEGISSRYVIFCIIPSRIPLSHSKYGITILDKHTAQRNFMESFYSNTELARQILSDVETCSASASPLMIAGEIGTGKDRVAQIYYAKSMQADRPLYVVNCARLSDKSWNFVINHYNSPFTDNGNTIYISNLDVLTRARQKQLLSTILDTNLHVRNRLMFSCTHVWGTNIPHVALEFTNALGCSLISIKPLREQREDMVSSAGLYIDTLNQSIGKQVVGFDDGAAELLKDYDYPYNRTQFKRILRQAVMETDTAYISAATISRILEQEELFFPNPSGTFPAGTKAADEFHLNLDLPLDAMNREIVLHVLKTCQNNQTAAAQKLGISRTTLWRYINR